MAIIKPEDMDFSDDNIVMIISGLPGYGKTTLALSAPDPLLVDADDGVKRTKVEHRKDSSIVKTYEDVLADAQQAIGKYKTFIPDTGGALIELMKEWATREHAAEVTTAKGKIDGRKVFGVVKSEFLRVSREWKRHFNVIYVFHESLDKEGDEVHYSIICEGSAKDLVWQPADIGAHLLVSGGQRYLGFSLTSQYTAKASSGISGLVPVPELKDGDKNDLLTRLFTQIKENRKAEAAALKPKKEAYEKAIALGREIIKQVEAPEQVLVASDQIKMLNHALTSEKELLGELRNLARKNGWAYDKEAGKYVAKAE